MSRCWRFRVRRRRRNRPRLRELSPGRDRFRRHSFRTRRNRAEISSCGTNHAEPRLRFRTGLGGESQPRRSVRETSKRSRSRPPFAGAISGRLISCTAMREVDTVGWICNPFLQRVGRSDRWTECNSALRMFRARLLLKASPTSNLRRCEDIGSRGLKVGTFRVFQAFETTTPQETPAWQSIIWRWMFIVDSRRWRW